MVFGSYVQVLLLTMRVRALLEVEILLSFDSRSWGFN